MSVKYTTSELKVKAQHVLNSRQSQPMRYSSIIKTLAFGFNISENEVLNRIKELAK